MNAQAPIQEHTCRPQENPDPLCDRCRSIDFDAIFSRQYPQGEDVPLMRLERPALGDCALCQLFAQYCGDDWGDGWLCSIRSRGGSWPDTRVLSILPSRDIVITEAFLREKGYIAEPQDALSWRHVSAAPRPLDPEPIDYSMIRAWLDSCKDKHRGSAWCRPLKLDSEWPIRFIDCETRRIVVAASLGGPSPPFLALSYVWGQPVDLQDRQPVHDKPLEDLPLTVRDSIAVTRKLGFRYLWVDKYCIRQDDEEDKRRQIRLMAEIYGSARVTIVAAAGSDSSYGLPGVSRPRRIRLPHARVGNRTLTWAFGSSSVRHEISSSVWSTRGWTYQEGLVSTRRLVFTDKLVYLQCGVLSFYEPVSLPLFIQSGTMLETIFPFVRTTIDPSDIGVRIQEYTRRKLSNEADILNAFQGIFSIYPKTYMPDYDVWGIPITARYDVNSHKTRCTSHEFLAGICWTLDMAGDRRHGFPSWSWTGWRGVVSPRYAEDAVGRTASNETDIVVSFEQHDGVRTEWSQLEPMRGYRGCQDHLRILVLDCPSFPFQVEGVGTGGSALTESPSSDEKPGLRATGDVSGHFYSLCKRRSWGSDQPGQGQLLGVPLSLIHESEPESRPPRIFILVFYKKSEFWERIGHFEWSNPEGETDFTTFLSIVPTIRTVLRIA